MTNIRCHAMARRAAVLLCLGLSPIAAAAPLTGTYFGQMSGMDAQLRIGESGRLVEGEVVLESGYVIRLQGERDAGRAAGTAASAAGAATFVLERNDEGVRLLLDETAPLTGQTVRMRLDFRPRPAETATPPPADDSGLDLRLAGVWLGSEIRHAGDMVLRIAVTLDLRGDGSYALADDTASGAMREAGQSGTWQARLGKLQLQPAGSPQWRTLGFYQLRGNELLLIDSDGRAQTWRRQ